MSELERRDYFPTTIFQGEIERHQSFDQEVLGAIYALREQDRPQADPIENREGNWRSVRNLHKRPEFDRLKNALLSELESIGGELQYSKEHYLKITSMWANIIDPGNGTRAECRPGSLWAGCYCLQVPKRAGSMKFIDPRTINIMNPPKYDKAKRPRASLTKVEFKPRQGHVVFFPAWLYHEVEPNLAEEDGRAGDFVFISFAVSQQKRS